MHGARQDRLDEGKGRADPVATDLDQRICRSEPRDVDRGDEGPATIGRSFRRGHTERGKSWLLQCPVHASSPFPARGNGHWLEFGLSVARASCDLSASSATNKSDCYF